MVLLAREREGEREEREEDGEGEHSGAEQRGSKRRERSWDDFRRARRSLTTRTRGWSADTRPDISFKARFI